MAFKQQNIFCAHTCSYNQSVGGVILALSSFLNLIPYQKGVYYSGIKIYNHLPTAIKDLSNDKNKFKLALKKYLLHNSFYSLEEYFNT